MGATARDLLASKNSAVVFTCSPDDTVAEACRVLRDRRIGCLVVMRDGRVQGLLGERHVATRVAAEGRDARRVRVEEVMEREVATVPLDARCEEVEALLRARRVHHLTVVGERGLLGLVSLGDVARFYAARSRGRSEDAAQPSAAG